ncbi:MAG: tRNA pseudouridine(13) synthase TruD [Desulfuromonas sp.]|nr:MAG: tRNA pseudouridine(13) synthase TruD [Desulfuromonas sp.]
MTFLTAGLPGTGGVYKQYAEDFEVEEIPLYPCSGAGEHLYLWIEKKGITTRDLIHQMATGLKLKDRDIGYAGLKDARAVTRQFLSVPSRTEASLARLRLNHATILSTARHGNKLRLGHLAGNRFSICLRNTHPEAVARAKRIFAVLEKQGVPNRFGEQRYGSLNNSHRLGKRLLQKQYDLFCRELIGDPQAVHDPQWRQAARAFRAGDLKQARQLLPTRMRDEHRLLQMLDAGKTAAAAVLALPRPLLRLLLSAYQSDLFDTLLKQRLPHLGLIEPGDIAFKHINGACFQVEDAPREQSRADQFEISPTAPLFGHKVLLADKNPGVRERTLLDLEQLTLADWHGISGLTMPGERRPLRVPLGSPQATPLPTGLKLSFALPKGSYATSVLTEIIKN